MPVLVYLALVRAFPTIAFYMGLACILSLSSVTYIKWLFHDQAYIFFNLLAVVLLVEFLWRVRFRMLYFFTLAAFAASFTRAAGNLMYPVLLTIAYVTGRGRFRHYLGCVLIFLLALGVYQWHRYKIFDMRNQPGIPSGLGMQVLFGAYISMGDFGIRLSPDLGPNSKRLLERLRQELQPTVRDSALIKRGLFDDPPEFMEKHVYAYTPEELFEKITTQPNQEYYWLLWSIDPDNDQFYLRIAWEIYRSHPWYVVQFSMRNLWHAFFDPGYLTPRYSAIGYSATGNDFIPGKPGWDTRSEDSVTIYGSRASRELEYVPLNDKPQAVRRIFTVVESLWLENFRTYVWITSVLIIIAWIGAFLGALCWAVPRTRFFRTLMNAGVDKLMAPVIAVSALVLYENLVTSMFAEPSYRYFHNTELLRLVIAGFGVAFITGVLSSVWPTRIAAIGASPAQPKRESVVSAIQKYDLLDGYFGRRRTQWIFGLIVVNASLFAWWASSMIVALPSADAIKVMKAAPDAQRLSDIHNLQKALDGYFKDHAVYPTTPEAVDCHPTYNNVGNLSGALVPKYIAAIPKDPSPKSCAYNYQYWSDSKNYVVMVHLENIDPGTYVDRWCIGAAGGSIAASPSSRYLRCP